MTFRSRTIAGIALLQLVVLGVILFITVGAMKESGRYEINRRADVTLRLITASAKDAMISKDFATLDAIVSEARATGSVAYLRFADESGNVLSEDKTGAAVPGLAERRQRVIVAGNDFGSVQLGIDYQSLDNAVYNTSRLSTAIAVIGLALTALFSWFLGSYLTRQLEALRLAGARLAAGELDTRVPITGKDELAETAMAFNSMAEKLQEVVRTLSQNEASLRTFSEASSDWYWETDKDHRITWLSPGFAEAARIDPCLAMGKLYWELSARSTDKDLSSWKAHRDELASHRKFRDYRYWIGKDKTAQWISISGAPRYDDSGIFVGYCGSGTNITAQAEIAMQLRLFSRIVDQSPVSVVITDPDGKIQYVNPRFAEVTGYDQAEVVGMTPRLVASGETPSALYDELWRTIKNKRHWQGELRNKRKTGQRYWEQAIIFPVLDDSGDIVQFVGIKEDITARKDVEIVLAERTRMVQRHYESLRALSDVAALPHINAAEQLTEALVLGARHLALPIGIISRIEGDTYTVRHHDAPPSAPLHDGQVFELGNTYCALTISTNDVVAIAHMAKSRHAGHPCYQAFGLEAYIGATITVRGQTFGTINFSSPDPYAREFDDGDIEFVRLLARWAGAVLERDLANQDILAAKDIAEAARGNLAVQARKLAEINAELEQFAYVASHDLRQPLRMVSSYLGLISKRLGTETDDEIKEFFAFAMNGAKRMDRMILDLLEYSRTGRHDSSFQLTPLADVVSAALANLEVAIAEAGAVVEIIDEMPSAQGSPTELERLFQNLVGNAIKYRAPDRPVRVQITCRPDGHEWLIAIRDNGIGISPEDRERAFKIFQRLVAQDAYEGTGIGLAVCRKIVESHEGRIWIEDGLNGGTAVCFSLPKS
ncbi:Putative signal transduction histidine kinase [Magnetospirillum sp. XM-1]|nr:Putative signal transduction histidine kinase [Magnetospirillum sp. XM-1]